MFRFVVIVVIVVITVLPFAFAAALSSRDILSFQRNGFLRLPRFALDILDDLQRSTFDAFTQKEREWLSEGFSKFGCDKSRIASGLVNWTTSGDSVSIGAEALRCHDARDDWSDSQFSSLSSVNSDLRRLLTSQRFAQAASELLQRSRIRFYTDASFFKDPRPNGWSNAATPWHVDLAFVPLDTNSFVTFWCALTNITLNDSFLRFAPTSHRDLARLYWWPSPEQPDEALIRHRYGVQFSVLDVNQTMAAGDCTAHHGWLLHGSVGEATGTSLRAAIGFSFVEADAKVLPLSDRLREGIDSFRAWYEEMQPHQVVDHKLLPLVWPITQNTEHDEL